RLLQNRDVYIDYLRHTQEQANTLRELVKQAKAKQPLDRELDFACKYAMRIQELLIYVQDTCPIAITPSTKKVAVLPMNNVKKGRFTEPLTSSSNIKQVESSNTSDSNTPVLSSTGVKYSTSNYGSKPPYNKRNDRISQTPSRNKKNKLAKDGLPRGIPRLKFQKDHLCSAYALGKSKNSSHQPKTEDTNQEKLYLLHMDLCGPMRVASINGKRYILVIVDDYSRFTWVRFLKTKDEALAAIIKCIKNIQVRLNATVRNVQTDNGTEFVNQTLCEFYKNVGISYQTFVARTPQQNGVVERQNWTLVEAARTMLKFSKAPLFLWSEAINTACYTQNRKFDAKADIGIFVGYAPAKKAFRIYNRRTQIISETIHVTFDELIAMASEQFSLEPGLQYMTPATSCTGLVSKPVSQQPCIPPNRDDWDRLFQPMFDEYFNPLTITVSPVQEAAAPRAEVLADSPVSISIN
ncbi:retrovirus-related pol polyprotein from transposon TNT 1-94, partial [Tanacetum coccineum]